MAETLVSYTASTLCKDDDRKGWPVEAILLDVHHLKDADKARLDPLVLAGPVEPDQCARLSDIAVRTQSPRRSRAALRQRAS